MNRRSFLSAAAGSSAALFLKRSARGAEEARVQARGRDVLRADLVVIGGGLGGCAAALAGVRQGLNVILTEQTDWVGGQLTQQGVPPDEHSWIETHGCTATYRVLRDQIRGYYRRHYPLSDDARNRENLNPGNGSVSRLCHEPRVALAVLESMLAPFRSTGKLTVLLEHSPIAGAASGDRVTGVQVRSQRTGREIVLEAPFFIDATELGDLLPMTGTEYVTGAESIQDTGELHAAPKANPRNEQAFTVCFAMDYLPEEEHVIERPKRYAFWRDFVPELKPPWPGKLLDWTYTHPPSLQPRRLGFDPVGDNHGGSINLWKYRRILDRENFVPGMYKSGITLVNWPQNDYFLGNLTDTTPEEYERHVADAKQLSLSLVYWLQTEAPRLDGKQGYPGLRLRRDMLGTEDGLAKFPYVRESRRIRPVFRVLEQHVGREARRQVLGNPAGKITAAPFADSVGVGYYHIDLHPSVGGDNYIDFPSLPFQIPLGALLPQRVTNLLPACKNIGTTHVTNGCYRLHPVEWSIGESAGELVAFALRKGTTPHAVREKPELLGEFQEHLRKSGIETQWPG